MRAGGSGPGSARRRIAWRWALPVLSAWAVPAGAARVLARWVAARWSRVRWRLDRRSLGRPVRRWLPDRNPLRRATDRIEMGVMAGLLMAFVVGAPLAAVAAGQWANAAGRRAERAQANWHEVPAVLLRNAPGPAQARSLSSLEPRVRARWVAPNGTPRTGDIYAPAGAHAGSTVLVWTNGSGRLTRAPLRSFDVVGWIAEAAGSAVVAVGFLLFTIGLLVRRILDRRRLRAWDARWAVTEPHWSGRA